MSDVKWGFRGAVFANCNCDYGCPCQFNALPTDGTCRAVAAWRIDQGHFGDLRLDGLNVAVTYGWPGAVHHGNGDMQAIVDERADPDQRKALAAIMEGQGAEPGVVMLQVFRAMCTTVHTPIVAPIELAVDIDARTARLHVPGVVSTTVEPIKNPVTGEPHRARIDLPMGKEFKIAEVASGTTKATGAVPLEFENSHAHMAFTETTSEGPGA